MHSTPSASATSHAATSHAAQRNASTSTHAPRANRSISHPRRGAVIQSILTLICSGAVLLTAALVLDPATLQARSTIAASTPTPRDAHQEFTRSLSSLISQSEQVLAVHPATEDRGCELILWFDDAIDHGVINASELALVRHSPLFRSITIYTAAASTHNPATAAAAAALDESDAATTGFIDRWRAGSNVQARVAATSISDLAITPINNVGDQQLSLLRLHLTWDLDSADGPAQTSTVVEAGRRRTGTQQEHTP